MTLAACSCLVFLWRTFEVAGVVLGERQRLQPLYDLLDGPVQERSLDFVLHFIQNHLQNYRFRYPTVHSVDISQSRAWMSSFFTMTSYKLILYIQYTTHLESTVGCLDTEFL